MRVCVICGGALEDRRSDALCCGGACRAERGRLLVILRGAGAGPYDCVVARLEALENRRRGATGGRLRARPQAPAPDSRTNDGHGTTAGA
ncbi:MAG: hypothetical protein QOG35_1616 [Solirubrobacteraceae bacterium]|jgi:hypothetical protein|nr:hypothetical protein [Solirubrobacteraceae bacterium]